MVPRMTSRSMRRYRLAMPTARNSMPSRTSTSDASTAPRCRRVEAVLRNQICTGEYRPGDRLPTQEDLFRDLGVSRPTVRRALHVLEQGNLIMRTAGRGRFMNAIAAALPVRRQQDPSRPVAGTSAHQARHACPAVPRHHRQESRTEDSAGRVQDGGDPGRCAHGGGAWCPDRRSHDLVSSDFTEPGR